MIVKNSDLYASCPWCKKGTTIADAKADVRISSQCSNCGKHYKVDFKTMRIDKIKPKVRKDYKLNPK